MKNPILKAVFIGLVTLTAWELLVQPAVQKLKS